MTTERQDTPESVREMAAYFEEYVEDGLAVSLNECAHAAAMLRRYAALLAAPADAREHARAHPRCQTCRHWWPPATDTLYDNPLRKTMGECRRTGDVNDMAFWQDRYNDDEMREDPEYADRTAAMSMNYAACLLTRPGHYCPMHSTLAADAPTPGEEGRDERG